MEYDKPEVVVYDPENGSGEQKISKTYSKITKAIDGAPGKISKGEEIFYNALSRVLEERGRQAQTGQNVEPILKWFNLNAELIINQNKLMKAADGGGIVNGAFSAPYFALTALAFVNKLGIKNPVAHAMAVAYFSGSAGFTTLVLFSKTSRIILKRRAYLASKYPYLDLKDSKALENAAAKNPHCAYTLKKLAVYTLWFLNFIMFSLALSSAMDSGYLTEKTFFKYIGYAALIFTIPSFISRLNQQLFGLGKIKKTVIDGIEKLMAKHKSENINSKKSDLKEKLLLSMKAVNQMNEKELITLYAKTTRKIFAIRKDIENTERCQVPTIEMIKGILKLGESSENIKGSGPSGMVAKIAGGLAGTATGVISAYVDGQVGSNASRDILKALDITNPFIHSSLNEVIKTGSSIGGGAFAIYTNAVVFEKFLKWALEAPYQLRKLPSQLGHLCGTKNAVHPKSEINMRSFLFSALSAVFILAFAFGSTSSRADITMDNLDLPRNFLLVFVACSVLSVFSEHVWALNQVTHDVKKGESERKKLVALIEEIIEMVSTMPDKAFEELSGKLEEDEQEHKQGYKQEQEPGEGTPLLSHV